MRKLIPVFYPNYDKREEKAVVDVLRSGWIGLGPKTEEFEDKFAKYIGANYAVAVNSATSALHLSMVAAGISKGDEVILPSLTFVSTANAVSYTGAKPIFADVDVNTLCISPDDVEKKITKKTKAIVPVHYGGLPCDMKKLTKIAKEHNLIIIEDAAHACGSKYKGKKIGSFSPFTCFSFHAVKNLATGDGGMITVKDKKIAEKLKRLRWVGISKDTWKRVKKVVKNGLESNRGYGWHYEIHELGFKYHMNDIVAALGIEQLKKLDKSNKIRRKIAKYYEKNLKGVGDIVFPVLKNNKDGTTSAQHNYVIQTKYRDKLHLFLRNNYISTGVHYIPVHMQPLYANLYPGVSLPNTELIWSKLLTLPLFPKLSRRNQKYVVDKIKEFFSSKKVDLKNSIRLRKLISKDLEILRKWRNTNKQFFFTHKNITTDAQKKWYREQYMKNPDDTIYIVKFQGESVGTLSLIKQDDGSYEIGRVMLGEKKYVRKGVMGAATEKLLQKYKTSDGCQRIFLEVIEDNIPAIEFYKKHKFNKVGKSDHGLLMERFI